MKVEGNMEDCHESKEDNYFETIIQVNTCGCYRMKMRPLDLVGRMDTTRNISFPPPSFMVFPVVMYGCESWTIKKAEH